MCKCDCKKTKQTIEELQQYFEPFNNRSNEMKISNFYWVKEILTKLYQEQTKSHTTKEQ
tara:strand:- start:386 stop:562 length:177 start_codon:yes stop_codon:yes gene_type:complete